MTLARMLRNTIGLTALVSLGSLAMAAVSINGIGEVSFELHDLDLTDSFAPSVTYGPGYTDDGYGKGDAEYGAIVDSVLVAPGIEAWRGRTTGSFQSAYLDSTRSFIGLLLSPHSSVTLTLPSFVSLSLAPGVDERGGSHIRFRTLSGEDNLYLGYLADGTYTTGTLQRDLVGSVINNTDVPLEFAWSTTRTADATSGLVAPVPEPETYALMLVGFGAVLLWGRRQRKGAPTAPAAGRRLTLTGPRARQDEAARGSSN